MNRHLTDRRGGVAVALGLALVALWPRPAVLLSAPSPLPSPRDRSPLRVTAPVCSPTWLAQWRGQGSSLSRGLSLVGAGPVSQTGSITSLLAPVSDLAVEGELQTIPPPNDTYFRSYQTHSLRIIGALDAWDISYGGPDVTVAVISSGVAYTHTDLAAKIWRNGDEIPGNGIDDDHNGYVDDVIGWNFAGRNPDPADFGLGLRGSMMAGIIGAETNNRRGIAGASWHARIMPLKVLAPTLWQGQLVSGGNDRDIVEAVCYAANNGAQVIVIAPTVSDPGLVKTTIDELQAAIKHASEDRGALVVAPAGDCGGDPHRDGRTWCPDGINPEIFPANLERVVGVQSVSPGFQLRDTGSSGPWVDISAPGEEFMTTGLADRYEYVSSAAPGVSDFAAAHVAGVAAVMKSVNPNLSQYRLLQYMCQSATKTGGAYADPAPEGDWLRNDRFGCGVLNFERAVEVVPIQVHGVTPAQVSVLADGRYPRLDTEFTNPYLNRGHWQITSASGASWLVGASATQPALGSPSEVHLHTDLDALRQQSGGEIAGKTYHDTLLACPASPDANQAETLAQADEAGCQQIPYTLRVVDRLTRLFLPQVTVASSLGSQ